MGMLFEVFKDGEKYISLTEHSVKNVKYTADTEVDLQPKINDITRDVVLTGLINIDKISEKPQVMVDDFGIPIKDDDGNDKFELREIDSVRKLANWAIIPEYCECYCDATFKLTNARGDLIKEESYEDLFVVDYRENFDDDSGVGSFNICLREREVKFMEQ